MDKNKERQLDAYFKKTLKDIGLEEPSKGFTDRVLSQIQMPPEKSTLPLYKPLISKKAWWAIVIGVSAVFAFLLLGDDTPNTYWVHILLPDQWPSFKLFSFLPQSISPPFVYGCLALTFFVYLEIFILKGYVNKWYKPQ